MSPSDRSQAPQQQQHRHHQPPTTTQFLQSNGQLKNNVKSRLSYLNDVFDNLSDMLTKFDAENRQLRQIVDLLLHFKYMLQYARRHVVREEELCQRLGPDAAILFKTDLNQCLAQFDRTIGTSQWLRFVVDKNSYYHSHGASYCSYGSDEENLMPGDDGAEDRNTETYTRLKGNSHTSNSATTSDSSLSDQQTNNNNEHNNDANTYESISIKLEPEVELIELGHSPNRAESGTPLEDDLSGTQRQSSAFMIDRASNSDTSPNKHRSTIGPTKVVSSRQSHKRPFPPNKDHRLALLPSMESGASNSKTDQQSVSVKRSKSTDKLPTLTGGSNSKQSTNEPQQQPAQYLQMQQDYDFDYEDEFDADDSLPLSAMQSLKCPHGNCESVFESESDLNDHLASAHNNFSFELPLTFECLVGGCNMNFPNLARANVHMKNQHPDAYISCEQCHRQVRAHYLHKHTYMRHRKGTYRCTALGCDFVAEYYHELEKHRYMMHPRGSWPDQAIANQMATLGVSSFSGTNSQHDNIPLSQSVGSSQNSNRTVRFNCRWPDCGFWHEKQSKVLRHIEIRHLSGGGGSGSGGGGSVQRNGISFTKTLGNGNGNAADYMEICDGQSDGPFF